MYLHTEFIGNQIGSVVVNGCIDTHHHSHGEELLHHFSGGSLHFGGQIADHNLVSDGNFQLLFRGVLGLLLLMAKPIQLVILVLIFAVLSALVAFQLAVFVLLLQLLSTARKGLFGGIHKAFQLFVIFGQVHISGASGVHDPGAGHTGGLFVQRGDCGHRLIVVQSGLGYKHLLALLFLLFFLLFLLPFLLFLNLKLHLLLQSVLETGLLFGGDFRFALLHGGRCRFGRFLFFLGSRCFLFFCRSLFRSCNGCLFSRLGFFLGLLFFRFFRFLLFLFGLFFLRLFLFRPDITLAHQICSHIGNLIVAGQDR